MNISEDFGEPLSTVLSNALMGCLKSGTHIKFAHCKPHFNQRAMRSQKQYLDSFALIITSEADAH